MIFMSYYPWCIFKNVCIFSALPHSLITESSEVCLLVKDLDKKKRDFEPTERHFKALLDEKGVTGINEVCIGGINQRFVVSLINIGVNITLKQMKNYFCIFYTINIMDHMMWHVPLSKHDRFLWAAEYNYVWWRH